jgi:hypothetical protein
MVCRGDRAPPVDLHDVEQQFPGGSGLSSAAGLPVECGTSKQTLAQPLPARSPFRHIYLNSDWLFEPPSAFTEHLRRSCRTDLATPRARTSEVRRGAHTTRRLDPDAVANGA